MSFLTVSESSHPFSTWKSQAIFSIGFFWTLRGGRKSPLRPLAQVAPSMYKGRLLLWLRAIRYPLNPLAAKLGSLLQKRRPASALPFGPWFDAWHGQHWPFSVGAFGKSWSLVCSIWKINDAMHFDGRNVEQVTETSAPCSILSIVTTLFCFCWRLLISMSNSFFFNSSVQGMFEGQTCTSVQQVSLGKWLSNNFGGSQWNRKRNEWAKLLHLWLSLMHS